MAGTKKTRFDTSHPYEKSLGYSRAIRKGNYIFVSGTTALKLTDDVEKDASPESSVLFPNDAGGQAKVSMQRCVEAVEKLGGTREDVVRVRMFVTNDSDTSAVSAVFKEEFVTKSKDVGVAATMIVGSDFIDPDILVEVEVDAICG